MWGGIPGGTDTEHQGSTEHLLVPRWLFWGSSVVGRRPRAKRASEGLGHRSLTETWNLSHLLRPALSPSGPEALDHQAAEGVVGLPIWPVPDYSLSISGDKDESSFTPALQETLSGGKQLETELPSAR